MMLVLDPGSLTVCPADPPAHQTHPCGDGIMGCCSEQAWPSRQAPLQAEQKTARQVTHGTAPGRPSVLGCRLHTA